MADRSPERSESNLNMENKLVDRMIKQLDSIVTKYLPWVAEVFFCCCCCFRGEAVIISDEVAIVRCDVDRGFATKKKDPSAHRVQNIVSESRNYLPESWSASKFIRVLG